MNRPLCDIFEMLVTRLGTLEDGQASLRRSLAQQDLAHRHEVSLTHVGTPISGVRLCGRCVRLLLHQPFTADGRFVEPRDNDMLILLNDTALPNEMHAPVWEEDVPWMWDKDVQIEWGLERFSLVRANMLAWYSSNPGMVDPSPEDVHVQDSGHQYAFIAIYEAALRRRHPGLLAIGCAGLAVADKCIVGAVSTVDAVTLDLGCRLSESIEIHRIPHHLQTLAIAILRETGMRAAWLALTRRARIILIGASADQGVFFSSERLRGCSG